MCHHHTRHFRLGSKIMKRVYWRFSWIHSSMHHTNHTASGAQVRLVEVYSPIDSSYSAILSHECDAGPRGNRHTSPLEGSSVKNVSQALRFETLTHLSGMCIATQKSWILFSNSRWQGPQKQNCQHSSPDHNLRDKRRPTLVHWTQDPNSAKDQARFKPTETDLSSSSNPVLCALSSARVQNWGQWPFEGVGGSRPLGFITLFGDVLASICEDSAHVFRPIQATLKGMHSQKQFE